MYICVYACVYVRAYEYVCARVYGIHNINNLKPMLFRFRFSTKFSRPYLSFSCFLFFPVRINFFLKIMIYHGVCNLNLYYDAN